MESKGRKEVTPFGKGRPIQSDGRHRARCSRNEPRRRTPKADAQESLPPLRVADELIIDFGSPK